jgi:hypothetical protein
VGLDPTQNQRISVDQLIFGVHCTYGGKGAKVFLLGVGQLLSQSRVYCALNAVLHSFEKNLLADF